MKTIYINTTTTFVTKLSTFHDLCNHFFYGLSVPYCYCYNYLL